jgi:hypothetical protein
MKNTILLTKLLKPFNLGNLVRLGGNKDGGYLLSNKSLSKCNFLISIGISYNWDFEKDFLKNKNIENLSIIAYDNSISLKIIKKFSLKNLIIFFIRPSFKTIQRISKFFSYIKTFNRKNAIHYPLNLAKFNSKKTINLDRIFDNIKNKSIILKIDIEGSEYLLMNDILKHLSKINVLIIEFHFIQKNKVHFLKFIKNLSKKFYVSHVHINNATFQWSDKAEIVECTFERKTHFKSKVNFSKSSYPLKNLDFPSSKNIADPKIIFK